MINNGAKMNRSAENPATANTLDVVPNARKTKQSR